MSPNKNAVFYFLCQHDFYAAHLLIVATQYMNKLVVNIYPPTFKSILFLLGGGQNVGHKVLSSQTQQVPFKVSIGTIYFAALFLLRIKYSLP